MKVKRKDLAQLYNGIVECQKLAGRRFAVVIHHAAEKIGKVIEEINAVAFAKIEVNPEYEKELYLLKREHADNDKTGRPLKNGSEFVIKKKYLKYSRAKEKLDKRFPEYVAILQERKKKVDKMLEGSVYIRLKKISKRRLPKEITAAQMKQIELIIRKLF
jgi:hypothetical protein